MRMEEQGEREKVSGLVDKRETLALFSPLPIDFPLFPPFSFCLSFGVYVLYPLSFHTRTFLRSCLCAKRFAVSRSRGEAALRALAANLFPLASQAILVFPWCVRVTCSPRLSARFARAYV